MEIQKFEYLENEKSFLDEINTIIRRFLKGYHLRKNKHLIKISGHKLQVKTHLGYHIAYYKSMTKSLYTFIQQTIKQEHTRRQLPLFTFTLNSGNT